MQISTHALTFGYPEKLLFSNVNITFSPGRIHWIAGPNGSGKSTFLKLLCGYLQPEKGEIRLDDQPLKTIPHRIRAKQIGVMTQIPLYTLDFTVEETIRTGCLSILPRFAPVPEELRERMREGLEYFGLTPLRTAPVNRLSGGERQKTALASMYALAPEILLLDEPTSALDPAARNHTVNWLTEYAKDHTVIAVTHDFELLGRAAGQLLLTDPAGTILAGQAETILTAENLERIYGTKATVEYKSNGQRRISFD
ncbi:MAG: ABC transporter ATP-binding protein [Lentisphaeria bacterium]|nr:ABC transporter ATP-binding protein [Lentisphaeria bacterium]